MIKVKQLAVGNQVLLLFGSICATLAAIGLFSFFSLRSIDQKNTILEGQILNELTLNNDIAGNARLAQNEISQYLREQDSEKSKQHAQIISNLEKTNASKWNDYGKLVDNETESRLYATALEDRKNYLEATDALLALTRANKQMEARDFALTTQAPAYEEYQRAIDEIVDWTAKESGQMVTASTKLIGQTKSISDVLIGIAILVSIGTGFVLRSITRRLNADNIVLQKAEETSRESEEKFRQMAENITDMFWITSPDMQQVLYVSPAYESIWGHSPESLYAHPSQWAEAIPPEDRERVFTLFSSLGTGIPSASTEFQISRPDGEMRWVYGRGFPVRDAAGQVIRLTGIASDVTERKKAETTQRESDEKFRQLAENITDVFWMTSPDLQKVLYTSPAYALIWGRSVENIYAHPQDWADAILPEQRERVFADFSKLTAGATSMSTEFQIARPDGTVRWIHSRGFPVQDTAGNVIRLAGVATDITERKRVVEELRESERRFSDMMRNLELISLMLDQEARITYCNDYLLRLTGWQREEVIGKNWFQLFMPPELINEMQEVFSRLLANQPTVWHHENKILTKSGVQRLIRWNNSVLRSPSGGIIGTTSIGEDITDQKRLEAQLFQSQKMETVGKLAGGVAHEFNSILTAIIGHTELLLSDLPPEGPLCKSVVEIRQAADRAATLTRQLLAYGRKQILLPEILDLNRILIDMTSTLQHLMGSQVDVRIIPALGLKTVKIDPGQMEQVLVNIAMNATDAMPNGGKFTLETANVTLDEEFVRPFPGLKPGDYVMLAMTDTGTGMSEDVKARAFDPFFSTKGVGEGPGLGLATCYGILKQSNGHMSVYSEEARGTTLKLYLPQVDHPAAIALSQAKVIDSPRGTETILLAEDDPFLLKMSAAFLGRQGYTVITAINGIEALNLKNKPGMGHIDLLLTDVVMPHMSGRELADRIHATYPHTKILYTSAYTENAIVHHGVLNDGVKFLQKPFTPTALANKVREVLDHPPL